ncbi:MAG: ABC transporter ATP-binding protein [Bifidobacteriaceae bacterium]|jgi:peptide/nickel transport system ATP-binding protein|nr:ABC transporter ATP-binding protein [Bifidobacteriaceae bacterium]
MSVALSPAAGRLGAADLPPRGLLQVEGLSVVAVKRDGTKAFLVDNLSFAVAAGSTHGLVGDSGSGKSMTANAIAGILPPPLRATGSVVLNGLSILGEVGELARLHRAQRLGFVFQNPKAALNPRLPIGTQLREALAPGDRRSTATALKRVIGLLDEVRLPNAAQRLTAYPHELSGGLAQRVVIALALARDPSLLIADEPTTALDTTIQKQILDLVDQLRRERGLGVLLITHDIGIVADRADRLTVLEDGRAAEQGDTGALLIRGAARSPVTRALVSGSIGLARVSTPPVDGSAAESEDVYVVSDARRSFDTKGRRASHVTALDGVNLTIQSGKSVGIVGESGSGKTTLARVLVGLERLDGGSVTYMGQPLGQLLGRSRKAWRAEVQFVNQDPWAALNPRRKLGHSIAEPLAAGGWNATARAERVSEVMAAVGLEADLANRFPGQLSGGQLQRGVIALALTLRPKVLIADEPVASLDVTVQARVIALLEELRDQFGLTYVLISHDLRIVRRLCLEVVVMTEGRVVERGPVGRVLNAPSHPYTRKLVDAVPGLGLATTQKGNSTP